MDRDELRLGGWLALVGGTVGMVVNAFHPSPPADPEELLRTVAERYHWPQLHFFSMLTTLCVVCSVALLSRNLTGGMARALGVFGRYLFLISGTAFAVMTMIDGFGFRAAAVLLSDATPANHDLLLAAGRAVVQVERSLFPVFSGVFLGMSFVVMGAAVWRSQNFPRWLGAWAAVGGLMCTSVGVGYAMRVPVPLPVWLIGLVVDIAWLLAAGVMMLRAGRRAEAVEGRAGV